MLDRLYPCRNGGEHSHADRQAGRERMTLIEGYHRVVQCAFENRMTHKLRMSHYISRFAAFFNDVRAKTSISASY